MTDYLSLALTGILATICMTAFSYVYSFIRNRQYREPVLLSLVLSRIFTTLKPQSPFTRLMGWAAHIAVGILFLFCYNLVWTILSIHTTLTHYVIAGAISGLTGIVIWKLVFIRYAVLREADQPEYFLQLELAHIVFGMASSMLTV